MSGLRAGYAAELKQSWSLLIGTFVMLGLVFVDHMIGNPLALY